MNEPKVSVIVPVYNVEKYLSRCLDSIVLQSYQNLDIVLVNDGSTDNSLKICQDYAENDSRIRLIDQNNKGLSGARNTGIDIASGQYICFIDSDDWVEPDYVEFMVKMSIEKDSDISIVSSYNSTDTRDIITTKGWISNKVETYDTFTALRLLTEDVKIHSHAWDKLYKISLFNNIRFPEGKNYEDIFIMHILFAHSASISISEQPKYHYYVRNNSIARNYKRKNILDYFEAEFSRLDYMQKHYEDLISLQNTKIMELVLSYYPKFKYERNDTSRFYKQDKKIFNKYVKNAESAYKRNHENFTDPKYSYMYAIYSKNRILLKIISPIGNNVISRVKTSKHKSQIKRLLYNDNKFREQLKEYSGKHKIILAGVPEYDNLGDVAIGFAEERFLRKYLSNNTSFLAISENNFFKYFNDIKKIVLNDDVIVIQGGGNFGDQYFDQEKLRNIILKNFKNKIILMPSTFYMKNKNNTAKYLKYYDRNNLFLFFRENKSAQIVSSVISNNIFVTPDIVLTLPMKEYSAERKGALLCLRNDVESNLMSQYSKKIRVLLCCRYVY